MLNFVRNIRDLLVRIDQVPLEKIFLFIALTFGLYWIFLIPPFQTPDEPVHFFRAWSFVDGQLECKRDFFIKKESPLIGVRIPESLGDIGQKLNFSDSHKFNTGLLKENLWMPLNKQKKGDVFIANACSYSPIPYLPQILLYGISNFFNIPPLFSFYLGRLLNFLCWVAIIYCAIKIIPFGKGVLYFLSLLPMSLFMAISLNADVVTNALCFLFIALVFRYSFQREKLSVNQIIIILFLSILISLTKVVYLGLILIILLIPKSKYISLRQYLVVNIGVVILSSMTLFSWLFFIRESIRKVEISYQNYYNFFPHDQIFYLIKNPMAFFSALLFTLINDWKGLLHHYLGVLGWLQIVLPWKLIYFIFIFAFFCLLSNEVKLKISVKHRVFLLFLFIAFIVAISFLFYISWNPVGSTKIEGLQGRYFIPIAPLVFFSIYGFWPNKYITLNVMHVYAILSSLIFLVISSYILLRWYY